MKNNIFQFFPKFCFPRKTPANKTTNNIFFVTTLAQDFFWVSPANPGFPGNPRQTPVSPENPGKPRQQKIATLAQELFSGFPQQTPVSPENPGTTNKK